ncbi:MAG: GGDEF domain-containing protein, partial [Lachnospiraceae bacterium]|nr:GGDEF domain-containing protein [Lachnospiraceae bacterium]
IEFEQKKFMDELLRMLQFFSLNKPLVLVLNRFHAAGLSTVRMMETLLNSGSDKNIAVVATYNELAPELEYTREVWQRLLTQLDERDCVVDWTLNTEMLDSDLTSGFKFGNDQLEQYYTCLNNMYYFLALNQAEYYLDILYHKFEVEKVSIVPNQKLKFLELCGLVAMCQDKTSDALLYCSGMWTLAEELDSMKWRYRYYFLLSEIYMYSFQAEDAFKSAEKCAEVCKHLNDPFLSFQVDMLQFMIHFQAWRDIWILTSDEQADEKLLNQAEEYGYYNHIAHIYAYSFENDKQRFQDVQKVEKELPNFNKGIDLAAEIGNSQMMIEAYKKNIMIASTNGYYEVANYFYNKYFEIVRKNNDLFEEAGIYNGMGYNSCTIEKYAKANEYFNQALLIFAKLNDIEYMNETIYNMAVNAIMAEEYVVADSYLGTCLKIIRIMKSNSVRVCNISKIYGLKAFCCYQMGLLYNVKIYMQIVEQFLGHIIELEDKDLYEIHIWDDDLFLYYFVNALLEEHANHYEEALTLLEKAEKYVNRSVGSEFFNRVPYVVARARICKKLGQTEQAESILQAGMQYCNEKGYVYRKKLIKAEMEDLSYTPLKWNLAFKGITLDQVVEMAVHKGVVRDYEEQMEEINFLSIWQKVVNNTESSIQRIIDNAIATLESSYEIDEVIFIRIEEGKPVIKYNDSVYTIDEDKVDYLVDYFDRNRKEFSITRMDKAYVKHKDLIERVFGMNSINTLICAPIFVNEQLSGLFIASVAIGADWNYKAKRYEFGENDLAILMMLYRQLLDAIERMETQNHIKSMNHELQFVNGKLKELAVKDILTGLYNRQGFKEELEIQMNRAGKLGRKLAISLLYADLDNFKYYNDTFGHNVGDLILKEFSALIKRICGNRGYAVRYGGDEFILVLYSIDRTEIERAAKEIYDTLEREKGFQKQIAEELGTEVDIPEERYVSCSIGISETVLSHADMTSGKLEETLKKADEMMYYVKKTTKHRYVFYEDIIAEQQKNQTD